MALILKTGAKYAFAVRQNTLVETYSLKPSHILCKIASQVNLSCFKDFKLESWTFCSAEIHL